MTPNKIILLALESSCDDTSAAVIINGDVVSNVTSTQYVHQIYGGVIPELASRHHMDLILPIISAAIEKAHIQINELSAIAFTQGPGLIGSLMVGVSTAKSIALARKIPLVSVHHMHAHILAHFATKQKPSFPFLSLTVSGGHTQIVCVHDFLDMQIVGSTRDDAAGEAFDKAGKMMGLPYPSGPEIDRIAQQGVPRFDFPEAQIEGYDFSFSGFKTSVLYFLQRQMAQNPQFINENLADICASVQTAIVRTLVNKVVKAAVDMGIMQIGIAGGVSANSLLRHEMQALEKSHGFKVYIPPFEYCTDNAAMIGIAGYYKYLAGEYADQSVTADPRLSF